MSSCRQGKDMVQVCLMLGWLQGQRCSSRVNAAGGAEQGNLGLIGAQARCRAGAQGCWRGAEQGRDLVQGAGLFGKKNKLMGKEKVPDPIFYFPFFFSGFGLNGFWVLGLDNLVGSIEIG
ncbi:hypothetical protein SLEP1_g41366 [Rubroshorea leprosula]|uniref:Uncharacterized protein n=1 Tax=Rubroshorea leprosula TaxID=152421 RepID=A0AAV5L7L9_9ROSI|nr:hypothetical protein SLEP1_g41366 [Rubroshorea leprosula]